MRLFPHLIALALTVLVSACASQPPRYRGEALASLQKMQQSGATDLFPQEFVSTLEAFSRGESLLRKGDSDGAERYFQMTLFKSALIERELAQEKARQAEEARRAEEALRAEKERLVREEAQRQAEARAKAEAADRARKESAEAERRKVRSVREHPQVTSHTVHRGESLPLIAAQPEVYGDRNLWPVLYRANRDQIGNPRHLWPGQVLRIPRNLSREDLNEARRYAQERPLH